MSWVLGTMLDANGVVQNQDKIQEIDFPTGIMEWIEKLTLFYRWQDKDVWFLPMWIFSGFMIF